MHIMLNRMNELKYRCLRTYYGAPLSFISHDLKVQTPDSQLCIS